MPLVKYRMHLENLWNRSRLLSNSIPSFREEENRYQNKFERRAIMQAGFLGDLETARKLGLISENEYDRSRTEGQRMREAYVLQARYFNSGLWMKTCILYRLFRMKASLVEWRSLFRRWMPISFVLITKLGMSYLRSSAISLKPRKPAVKAEIP
jgi:hypothetical protein